MPSVELDLGFEALSVGSLETFKELMIGHGALGSAGEDQWIAATGLSELQKMHLVPLAFGLMPPNLFQIPNHPFRQVKPSIVAHLQFHNADATDVELIEIIKHICDHYVDCVRDPARAARRKSGMRDLKANRQLYDKVMTRQHGRCSLCGVLFSSIVHETLDHVIPYKLLGDPPDALNWQVLCNECNGGKAHYISALQSPEAWNWIYGQVNRDTGSISQELRYVALSSRAKCARVGCDNNAKLKQMHIRRSAGLAAGIGILWNVEIMCEDHLI